MGNGVGLGAWAVWAELRVTRWNPRVFHGKRVASWQSPFREIPNDLSKDPGDASPAFSLVLTVHGRARESVAEPAGEQTAG